MSINNISDKELSLVLKNNNLINDDYFIPFGEVRGIPIYLCNMNESCHVRLSINNNEFSIVLIKKDDFFCFSRKTDLIISSDESLENIYVIMHEIGHAKLGDSESQADTYALDAITTESSSSERISIVYSQLVDWYNLSEKPVYEQKIFWKNYAGLVFKNDPHLTKFRFEVMNYALTELEKL